MKKTHLLYLHGFNSSPNSLKAQQTKRYFVQQHPQVNVICPQLNTSPNAVVKQIESIISTYPQDNWLLMGSSLGGYFATYLAEKYLLPAVLINPAVKPYELMEDYIGEQINPYTGECYQVNASFITDLKALDQKHLSRKNNYFVMVQTGDEVLDYQQAVEKYKNKQLCVQQGGDHSFVDYDKMLPQITKFFQLS